MFVPINLVERVVKPPRVEPHSKLGWPVNTDLDQCGSTFGRGGFMSFRWCQIRNEQSLPSVHNTADLA